MTSRNVALADFLRSRRERLAPDDVALPPSTRRRVRGLRREEVALLADLGIVWYTWLEQGRPIRMSRDALDRVAATLRMTEQETRYLYALVETGIAGAPPWNAALPEHIGDLVAGYGIGPAYALSPRWDVVAWNDDYANVYESFSGEPIAQHNMLQFCFLNDGMRAAIVDWPTAARRLVAMFRADYAMYVGDSAFDKLVTGVAEASAEFADLWAEIEVDSSTQDVANELIHPIRGRVMYRIITLAIPERLGYTVVFHVPRFDLKP